MKRMYFITLEMVKAPHRETFCSSNLFHADHPIKVENGNFAWGMEEDDLPILEKYAHRIKSHFTVINILCSPASIFKSMKTASWQSSDLWVQGNHLSSLPFLAKWKKLQDSSMSE
jgi:hypothetical protein